MRNFFRKTPPEDIAAVVSIQPEKQLTPQERLNNAERNCTAIKQEYSDRQNAYAVWLEDWKRRANAANDEFNSACQLWAATEKTCS
jgi:hypothetical protein